MIRPTLAGRSILIVEDEALIALDIAMEFEKLGAVVVQTQTLKQATDLIEAEGLSAAIIDHALQDGDSSQLCERLAERGIPFVVYSGYSRGQLDVACHRGFVVDKPAHPALLVATVQGLLKGRQSDLQ